MPQTLYDYYKEQGKPLPSVAERRAGNGLGADYIGNVEQNNALLAKLQTPAVPVVPRTDTIASKYKTVDPALFTPKKDPTEDSLNKTGDYYKQQSEQTIDQDGIYNQKLKQFQGEIDAINQIYAEKLRGQQEISRGNLGTTTSIAARSGALGSPIGDAQYKNVQAENQDAEGSVLAEQGARIAAILGMGRAAAADEIAAKRAAKEAGTKDYLGFLKDKQVRTDTKLSGLAKSLIAQGVNPDEVDPTQLDTIAKLYGTSTADLKARYRDAKTLEDEKTATTIAEKNKALVDANKALPASAQEYSYAKDNGYAGSYIQYQNEDANRKASVARAGAIGLTPGQLNTTVNSIAGAFDNEAIVKNFNVIAEGKKFADSLPLTTTNPANDQALIYALAKALDPGSVVREGEYATAQKYAQSLAQSYGKSFTQALYGSGFLSEDARKNIKATINSRYQASKVNYENLSREYQRQVDDARAGNPRVITNYAGGYETPAGEDSGDDIDSFLNSIKTWTEKENAR